MTTIELQRGTIELPEADETGDHDEIFSHLYTGKGVALCGLPGSQDRHHGCHPDQYWKKGMMACPKCGAPLCMNCLLAAS